VGSPLGYAPPRRRGLNSTHDPDADPAVCAATNIGLTWDADVVKCGFGAVRKSMSGEEQEAKQIRGDGSLNTPDGGGRRRWAWLAEKRRLADACKGRQIWLAAQSYCGRGSGVRRRGSTPSTIRNLMLIDLSNNTTTIVAPLDTLYYGAITFTGDSLLYARAGNSAGFPHAVPRPAHDRERYRLLDDSRQLARHRPLTTPGHPSADGRDIYSESCGAGQLVTINPDTGIVTNVGPSISGLTIGFPAWLSMPGGALTASTIRTTRVWQEITGS